VVRKGLEKTTLEDIAQEAGQPRPLVRYFVGNRADLVSLLTERIVRRGEERLETLRKKRAQETEGDVVEWLFESFFSDDFSNRLVAELWHAAQRSDDLRRSVSEVYRRVLSEMAKHIARGEYGQRADTSRDTAYALFSASLGATVLRHLGVPPPHRGRHLRTLQGLTTAIGSKERVIKKRGRVR